MAYNRVMMMACFNQVNIIGGLASAKLTPQHKKYHKTRPTIYDGYNKA
jgi:hypothetical protein